MDPNLTYPIILNQTLNATLNATLYEPVRGFEEWLKPSSLLGIGQILTALALIYLTNANTKISDRSLDLSKNHANLDAKKREYNLLREEMDKLVAPLNKAYRSTQAAKNFWGFFEPLDQRNRGTNGTKDHFQFWDGIRSNIYLSQSEDLRKSVNKYLFEYDNLFLFGGKGARKKFWDARFKLLLAIKERYPELIKGIDSAEKEIRSAEIQLTQKEIKKKSWWQFWK